MSEKQKPKKRQIELIPGLLYFQLRPGPLPSAKPGDRMKSRATGNTYELKKGRWERVH